MLRRRLAAGRGSLSSLFHHRLLGRPLPASFIVLTTSRSGSTWLCDLISKALYLEPVREDFRPEHFQAFQERQLSAGALLALAQSSFDGAARPPRLGTKLIWDSVPELEQGMSPGEVMAFVNLYHEVQPKLLRLVRRDRIAQAVSRYRAAQSGVFHQLRDSGALAKPNHPRRLRANAETCSVTEQIVTERSVADENSYDFARIYQDYELLVRAERHLDATLGKARVPVHTLIYEELAADPVTTVVNAVNYLLGGTTSPPYLPKHVARASALNRLIPTASDHNAQLAARFASDLSAMNANAH